MADLLILVGFAFRGTKPDQALGDTGTSLSNGCNVQRASSGTMVCNGLWCIPSSPVARATHESGALQTNRLCIGLENRPETIAYPETDRQMGR